MKIALICTEKLPVPSVAGGAIQLYIDGIVPYLSREHDITVFSIEYPGLAPEEVKENIKYIRVPAKTRIRYVENIADRLDDSFDLVHVFNRPPWVLSLSEDLPNTKFSLSLHNEMFHPEKISRSDALRCIDKVEFINTVSRYIADGVKALYPPAESKLHVVYSGVDVESYKTNWSVEGLVNKNRLKEKYDIKDRKVILFVGRLSPKKGTHILLKAMKSVTAENPDTALVIIGSKWYGKNEKDDYTRSLETLSQDFTGPIVFTGFLPPSQIPSHYNLGDIFVCASQWDEPLARVHYEAMAAGLPIITTHRGGNAEVVAEQGNGIVINDYSNPKAFADAINYLLGHPQAAFDIGEKGRKLAEEKYNWARVASEVLKPFSYCPRPAQKSFTETPKPQMPLTSEAACEQETNPNFFTVDF